MKIRKSTEKVRKTKSKDTGEEFNLTTFVKKIIKFPGRKKKLDYEKPYGNQNF